MAGKRKKLHEMTIQEDIRYRGFLNYQHFQIFGWLCIVLSVVSGLLSFGARFDEGLASETAGLQSVLANVTEMSLPFQRFNLVQMIQELSNLARSF